MYRCRTPQGSSRIAKLIPGAAYPMRLHSEAADKGLAPRLLDSPGRGEGGAELPFPGGFLLVEMEDLLSGDQGWQQMADFGGDVEDLEIASLSALEGLHSCLGGAAVHGDLRAPNIFVRWVLEGEL